VVAPEFDPSRLSRAVQYELENNGRAVTYTEIFSFYKCNQLPTETVAEYLAELRRLATCEFAAFLNEALCDRFVCGLNNSTMQQKLLSEPNLGLAKACELAQGMEATRKDAKEMQSPPTGVSKESLTNRVGSGSSKPCSRCLGAGHLPSECRFKSVKCNKCFRTGHIAKACKSKAPTSTRRSQQSHYQKKDADAKSHSKRKGVDHIDSPQQTSDEDSTADIIHVHSMSPTVPKIYKVPVELNDKHLEMELDT